MASEAVAEICRLMPEFSEAHAKWALAVSDHGNALSAMEVLLNQPDDFADRPPPELDTANTTMAREEEQDTQEEEEVEELEEEDWRFPPKPEPVTFQASMSRITRFHAVLDLGSHDIRGSTESLVGLLREGDKLVVDSVDENSRMVYFRLYSQDEYTSCAAATRSSPPPSSATQHLPKGRKPGGSGAARNGADAQVLRPSHDGGTTPSRADCHSLASSSEGQAERRRRPASGDEQRRRRHAANEPAPEARLSHLTQKAADASMAATRAQPLLEKSAHRTVRTFRPPAVKGLSNTRRDYPAADSLGGDSRGGGYPSRAW